MDKITDEKIKYQWQSLRERDFHVADPSKVKTCLIFIILSLILGVYLFRRVKYYEKNSLTE